MTAHRASAPQAASNRAAKSYAPPKAAALPIYRTLPVSELVPFAGNPRLHSPDQVAKIAASITEFGFTNPILIDAHRRSSVQGYMRPRSGAVAPKSCLINS
jgi:hypothetical protein